MSCGVPTASSTCLSTERGPGTAVPSVRGPGSAGFTLAELMVSTAVLSIVTVVILAGYLLGFRMSKSCGWQVDFTATGREAAQQLIRYVEAGRAASVTSNGVEIVTLGLGFAKIAYVDEDSNASTVTNNLLVYYPNGQFTSNRVVICQHVTPIAGTPMFRVNAGAPSSISFAFHVGDATNAAGGKIQSSTGEGFQGSEVRVSATPRNMQRWYE